MYRAGFIALTMVLLSAGLAEAACSVSRWRFSFGSESAADMTTDGAPCRTTVSWTAGTTEIHGIRISSPPRNGTAQAGGSSVTYKPKAGFKGTDSFAFTITGRRLTTPGTATVRVSVSVH